MPTTTTADQPVDPLLFSKRILVTGGAGFIGSHVVIHLVQRYPQYYIVNFDALDYCSCVQNVHSAIACTGGGPAASSKAHCRADSDNSIVKRDNDNGCCCENSCSAVREHDSSNSDSDDPDVYLPDMCCATLPTNYKFVHGNITDADLVNDVVRVEAIDTILHFAAQSHVDNSFCGNSLEFSTTNVGGTHVLLEAARRHGVQKFIHVSTDEVYGDGRNESAPMTEDHGLEPTNPYAATKAGAEFLATSFYRSFRLPVIITRSNNAYGPHQYPEKLIPKFVNQILRNRPVTIHGDGRHTRNYLYISDVVAAFDLILHEGAVGEVYNIGGTNELSSKEVAMDLLALMKPELQELEVAKLVTHVQDRPCNDHRYIIDATKIRALGWKEKTPWREGLRETVEWFTRYRHRFNNIDQALEAHPINFTKTC
ncbi:unnamed protein product [Hyaloperonospora brassicae]|uniref:NAD(P)-binding domain-containing protein n=1 Tax=Hyaloperonospora brassicae TaxID=162125 RepID=A0AAV0TVZ7_HYABA|nr:unnamed protein product [Hyaloperonospora brassicae]